MSWVRVLEYSEMLMGRVSANPKRNSMSLGSINEDFKRGEERKLVLREKFI